MNCEESMDLLQAEAWLKGESRRIRRLAFLISLNLISWG